MSGLDGRAAVEVVRRARGPGDVVVTTMGTARDWMAGGIGPLDFVLVPSSMGQATSVGLGLALARPDRRVIVLNGDGSMLMNLGSLATMAAQGPANLVVVVFVNGVYEITGSQPIPGGAVDFAALAGAVGFRSIHRFEHLADWDREARDVILGPGPTFVTLAIVADPTQSGVGPRSPGPAPERARRFRDALGVVSGGG